MSEYPLRTLGRSRKSKNNRAGYTALNDEDSPVEIEEGNMPLNVRAPAGKKGKRRERYEDSPEEEDTLLGEEHQDVGGFDEQSEADTVSQVSTFLLRVAWVSLTSLPAAVN